MIWTDTPELQAPSWARLSRVARGRWRVTDRTGRVVGHVHSVMTEGGWRYAAERFSPASRTFRRLGDFWTPEEALDCLRYQR
jgi:hypothetical protein